MKDQIVDIVGKFHASLKFMQDLDSTEIMPKLKEILAGSHAAHDQCLVGTYLRFVANIRTTVTFSHNSHFQAIAMLARANIELAMDLRLLSLIASAPEKMMAFERSEKLKVAQRIVDFASKSGAADVEDLALYRDFIKAEGPGILALRKALWGNEKAPQHWSEMNIRDRAIFLKEPFESLYEVEYARLSWHVHAGVTPVLGLAPEVFTMMCGRAFGIALQCYGFVLDEMIDKCGLLQSDTKINAKVKYARVFPFVENQGQLTALKAELFG